MNKSEKKKGRGPGKILKTNSPGGKEEEADSLHGPESGSSESNINGARRVA